MTSNSKIIKEFCNIQTDTRQNLKEGGRISILSQIMHDLDYNLGRGVALLELELTPEQWALLANRRISSYAAALLYCSAIDLMARVWEKQQPPSGRNGEYFTEAAKNLFPFSQTEKIFYPDPDYADVELPGVGSYAANKDEQAEDIWNFRNTLSHSYSPDGFEISTASSTKLIEKNLDGTKTIFVRYMPVSLAIAIEDFEKRLVLESEEQQDETVELIEKQGFLHIAALTKST